MVAGAQHHYLMNFNTEIAVCQVFSSEISNLMKNWTPRHAGVQSFHFMNLGFSFDHNVENVTIPIILNFSTPDQFAHSVGGQIPLLAFKLVKFMLV